LFFHTGKDRADPVRAQLHRTDLSAVANIRQTTTADLGKRQGQSGVKFDGKYMSLIRWQYSM